MKNLNILLAGALLGVASSAALAADTRQDRMDEAYANYKNRQGSSSMSSTTPRNTGRLERTENAVKRGAHKVSESVKTGARKFGKAVKDSERSTTRSGEMAEKNGKPQN